MLRHGRDGTDVFGLRLMWASLEDAVAMLRRLLGSSAEAPALLQAAFGRTLFIHLTRADKVAQAVSLLRAEQSGLWHLHADGSVLEGTAAPAPVRYDGPRLAAIVGELEGDDRQWAAFFAGRQILPLRLSYEALTADPQASLATVLGRLGLDPAAAAQVPTQTARMADTTSQEWIDRFRREQG